MPRPILVVEVISATTRQRDRTEKRRLYREIGIPTYWIIDRHYRTVRIVTPGAEDVDVADTLVWHPEGAPEPFVLDVSILFARVSRDRTGQSSDA